MLYHFRVVIKLRSYANSLLDHVDKDVIRIGIESLQHIYGVEEAALLLLTAWLDSGVPETVLTRAGRQAVTAYREQLSMAEAAFGD